MKHYVYAIMVGNEVVYVGRTTNVIQRFKSHLSKCSNATGRNTSSLYKVIYNALSNEILVKVKILNECESKDICFHERRLTVLMSRKYILHNKCFLVPNGIRTFDNSINIKCTTTYIASNILKYRLLLVYKNRIELINRKHFLNKDVYIVNK